MLRASGVRSDVRIDKPYEVYDKLEFDVPVLDEGDAYARAFIGWEEMRQSISIVKQVIRDILPGPHSLRVPPIVRMKPGEAFARIESARGEAAVYMVSTGGLYPYRVKVRGPSLLHPIPVLEHLLVDAQIADVPVIY